MLLIVHISYQTPLGPTFDLGAESIESSGPRVRAYSALLPSYVDLPQHLGSSSPRPLTSDIDLNDNVLGLAFDDTNSSRTYFSRGSLIPSKAFPLPRAQNPVDATNYFEPDRYRENARSPSLACKLPLLIPHPRLLKPM